MGTVSVMSDIPNKPWVELTRYKKKITLDDEMNLIKLAQDGDRNAMAILLKYYDPFAVQLAKKAVWFTGAYNQEEDIAQIARLVLFEKVSAFDFGYIAARSLCVAFHRIINPTYQVYRPARLSSYAFREIRRRMMQHACKNLEIVPSANSSISHAAHHDLDNGVEAEEISERLGISVETVESLERHTVLFDEEAMDFSDESSIENDVEEDERRKDGRLYCWFALTSSQRLIMTMLYCEPDRKKRAKIYGIALEELELVESEAKIRFEKLRKEIEH